MNDKEVLSPCSDLSIFGVFQSILVVSFVDYQIIQSFVWVNLLRLSLWIKLTWIETGHSMLTLHLSCSRPGVFLFPQDALTPFILAIVLKCLVLLIAMIFVHRWKYDDFHRTSEINLNIWEKLLPLTLSCWNKYNF